MSASHGSRPLPELIQQHPPERGERKKKYIVLYSCCCCCCCCLHTLGGAIGAVVAGNYSPEPEEDADEPLRTKRYPSSQSMFWSSFLCALLAAGAVAALQNPSQMNRGIVLVGLSVVLLGPAWQLAASALSALQIAFRKDLPCKHEYWRQLGKITAGMLAGTLIGVLVMAAVGVALLGIR